MEFYLCRAPLGKDVRALLNGLGLEFIETATGLCIKTQKTKTELELTLGAEVSLLDEDDLDNVSDQVQGICAELDLKRARLSQVMSLRAKAKLASRNAATAKRFGNGR